MNRVITCVFPGKIVVTLHCWIIYCQFGNVFSYISHCYTSKPFTHCLHGGCNGELNNMSVSGHSKNNRLLISLSINT